jgi:transposase
MLSLYFQKKILSLYENEQAINAIQRLTGHSRNTVRKVIRNKKPYTFKTSPRPSKLDKYRSIIKEEFVKGTLSREQIFQEITEHGYDGSFSTLSNFLTQLKREKEAQCRKAEQSGRKRREALQGHTDWIINLLQRKISCDELEMQFSEIMDSETIQKLNQLIHSKALRHRNRATAIFANHKKIPINSTASILGCQRNTIRCYIRKFESGGVEQLFDFSRKKTKKFAEPKYVEMVFKILHSPPSGYGFNRTSWRMEDLYRTLAQEGHSLSKPYIRRIIKNAGYRFLKAKKVLTSNDPKYHEKLKEITNILSNLKINEKFFSIDEFGPFAIKMQGGRSWVPQGENRIVPQWQKSKGSLILTAALELSTNQVTHFYSAKKNTDEMIKLLEILLEKYKDEDRIFFSWDAASWHASKELYKKVDKVNGDSYRSKHKIPFVALAPLPTRAQFLNVIESIFSGMAKAIIHNSDYASVEECKAAIDRYFAERNQYFLENPKRAGNKIWGKEITKVEFNESNNCKDPRYG